MNALGLQGASLKISLASGLLGVLTVQFLVPVIGLWGAVVSLGCGSGIDAAAQPACAQAFRMYCSITLTRPSSSFVPVTTSAAALISG